MDGFREKVDAASRNLKDAKVKVKTEFDRKGDLIHDLDAEIEEATRGSKGAKLDVVPHVQQSSFQKAMRDVQTQAKLANVKVDIDFKNKEAERRLVSLIERLKAIAAIDNIKLRVTPRRSIGGGMRGFMGTAKQGAETIGTGVAQVAQSVMSELGSAFMLLKDQMVLIAVAIVSLLAPALSLFSQLIVGLPALIGAIALPMAVLAIGMGGIKKALDDAGILDLVTGKTKKGAPTGKDKQTVGEALKEVQKNVSDVFEHGLTPVFKQLGAALPALARGLPFVAQGIVDLTQSVVNAVTSAGSITNFDRFTNSVSTMMTRLGPGLTSFTNGMIALTTNVGDHLPGLGAQLGAWGTRFSNWVTEISKPKKSWFSGGDIPNSSTLDSAVQNMKPILNSIIDFVGKLTDAGLKLAANPQMAANIKMVVDGLTNFVLQVLPGLNSFFDKIAKLFGNINPPGAENIPKPGLPPAHGKEQYASTPKGQAPADRAKDPQGPNAPQYSPKKSALENLLTWAEKTFTRPHTDHPVIVEGNVGGQNPPLPKPKVDPNQFNGIAQSVQANSGAIAAAANEAFKGLISAATVAVSQSVAAVQQLPSAVAKALSGLGPAGLAAGQALGTGMAAGIAAGAPAAIAAATALAQGVEAAAKNHLQIKSPSQVFNDIGQNTAQGFQNGLESGFQGVLDSTRNLTKQLSDDFSQGIKPNIPMDQVKQQIDAIGIEQEQLRAQSAGTADKGQKTAIKGQLDQLNIAKDQLKVQGTQLGYSDKYGDKQHDTTKEQEEQLTVQQQQLKTQLDSTTDKGKRRELQQQIDNLEVQKKQLKLQKDQQGKSGTGKQLDMAEQLGGSVNKMVDIGKNFAMANVNQFESDVGISGKGAIPTIANIGLDWGSQMLSGAVHSALSAGHGKTEIHVNSVDEALAAKRTTENRQALTHNAGR